MDAGVGRVEAGRVRRLPIAEGLRTWAAIGVNSFGGPAGQVAVMHRELVQRRQWVSEQRFQHALNTCVLLPGPEAMQLATYLGWLVHGVRGGVVAGALFILPGFLVMLGLAAAYAATGTVAWVAALLAGLQAAIVPIVAQACVRLGRRALNSPLLIVIGVAAFAAAALLAIPFPVLLGLAAAIGWVVGRRAHAQLRELPAGSLSHPLTAPALADGHRRPLIAALAFLGLWLVPVLALLALRGAQDVYAQMAVLFSKAAILTFGGAYAILGYVCDEAVVRYGWLTSADMASGLALAESTPGPLVLVLEFVGFQAAYQQPGNQSPLVAGALGAVLAAWMIFIPAFAAVFVAAPYAERLRGNPSVAGALAAISAAVFGAVLELSIWLAANVLFQSTVALRWGPVDALIPDLATVRWPMVAVAAVASILVFGVRRVPTLAVLGVCGALGILLHAAGWLAGYS